MEAFVVLALCSLSSSGFGKGVSDGEYGDRTWAPVQPSRFDRHSHRPPVGGGGGGGGGAPVAAPASARLTEGGDGQPSVTVGPRTFLGRRGLGGRTLEFLGIAYARQPTGGLRWFPPVRLPDDIPAVTTDHSRRFGPMCLQNWGGAVAPNPDGTPQTRGEDCLVLNVYMPANATPSSKLPVLVFGHGGGDGDGASSMGLPLLFNGSNAVVATPHVHVVINYRLATMGYLAHPAFASEPSGSQGNFGLLDHLAALQWVNRSIAAFGGDPSRVLFWGQSSGANHALWIPVMPRFRGLVTAVAAHSACGQPFYNPDCALMSSRATAEQTALRFASAHNCTDGGDAAIRACLRAIPASQLGRMGGDRPYPDGALLETLPYLLYAAGKADPAVTLLAGHNSGESVEMADSCLNNPALDAAGAPAALRRAWQHNRVDPPPGVMDEASQLYLANRTDGHPPCSAGGDPARGVPRCCRIYEDFWQDLNMQCSEQVLFDAVAAAAPPPPPMYGWRFDAVQRCPPAVSGWPGLGDGKPAGACFHTMDLSWMFGTVSGFWPWVVPPNGAASWNCSWSRGPAGERTFSDQVCRAARDATATCTR